MVKLFDISINDKLYPVYKIKGKEHQIGTYNGYSNDWWLLYDDNLDETKLLDEMSINTILIPFIDKGVHKVCWEISYKQYNNIVYKYHEYDIRDGGKCVIKANGREVYSFYSSDLMYAMSKVSVTIQRILGHPYNFFEPEKDNGRKIFFCGLPALVYQGYEIGEIKIKPDYSVIDKKKWWKIYEFYNSKNDILNLIDENEFDLFLEGDNYFDENETAQINQQNFEENYHADVINWGDALEDGKINWFRQ